MPAPANAAVSSRPTARRTRAKRWFRSGRCASRRIADYLLRARGMRVEAAQVVVGSGAEYLYGLLAQVFRGEAIAIEEPAYPKIREVYSAHGIACERLRLSAHGIRVYGEDDVAELLRL